MLLTFAYLFNLVIHEGADKYNVKDYYSFDEIKSELRSFGRERLTKRLFDLFAIFESS